MTDWHDDYDDASAEIWGHLEEGDKPRLVTFVSEVVDTGKAIGDTVTPGLNRVARWLARRLGS